jgi:hypothetical protein
MKCVCVCVCVCVCGHVHVWLWRQAIAKRCIDLTYFPSFLSFFLR